MLGNEYVGIPLRMAMTAAPVAIYFLVLGLLNSRRHPQLLTYRLDFLLLIVAMSPLLLFPILALLGPTLPAMLLAAGVFVALAVVLGPRGRTWVIYNMDFDQACRIVERSLEDLDLRSRAVRGGFELLNAPGAVRIGGFPLLKNVSIGLEGADEGLARGLESQLSRRLSGISAQTSPMAASMLLVATALLVVPLCMVANRVPELVRILTDLLR